MRRMSRRKLRRYRHRLEPAVVWEDGRKQNSTALEGAQHMGKNQEESQAYIKVVWGGGD